MFHFQTKRYGGHKASDAYMEEFLKRFDEFMEVSQGAFGRLTTKNINISIDTLDDTTINKELDSFVEILKEIDKEFEGYSEILNLRDELTANAERLKYLLTFT